MFPLAGNTFPESSDELARAIEEALGAVFNLPNRSIVQIGDETFPKLNTTRINLSGAQVRAGTPPPIPKAGGQRRDGVKVDRLEITAEPIQYERTQLNFRLSGSGLVFDYARDQNGRPLLVLSAARDGQVDASVSRRDIETLLRAAAEAAADQQGIKVQGLDLDLRQEGPRTLIADVRIKARKMMMSGTITLRGRLDVDEKLNAAISRLTAEGEGFVAAAAAAIVQKKLARYDGMNVPLMAFSLGDVALRDLKISVTNDVQVSAGFGKA